MFPQAHRHCPSRDREWITTGALAECKTLPLSSSASTSSLPQTLHADLRPRTNGMGDGREDAAVNRTAAALEAVVSDLDYLSKWAETYPWAATHSKARSFLTAATATGRVRYGNPERTTCRPWHTDSTLKAQRSPATDDAPCEGRVPSANEKHVLFPHTAQRSDRGLLRPRTASLRWRCSTSTLERVPRREWAKTSRTPVASARPRTRYPGRIPDLHLPPERTSGRHSPPTRAWAG